MQTIQQAWDIYILHIAKMGRAPLTIKQYKIDGKQFIRFCWDANEEYLQDETIGTLVEAYREHLQERYTNTQSINRKFASLRSFLQYCHFREWLRVVPEQYVKPLPRIEKHVDVLTDKEREQAVNVWLHAYQTIDEKAHRWMALRNFCITRLVAELALKPYEVVKMKWSHIDEAKGTVRIFGSRSHRDLELSTSMQSWLMFYEKQTHELFPALLEAEHMWLGLSNKAGEPITVKTIERIMLHISKVVDKKITCTNLRYSAMRDELIEQDRQRVKQIYEKYGYVQHSVMEERRKRIFNLRQRSN
ncbi:tyrosine-type recombinase/integrase [Caryophanon tenue]|uniref:Core-binding (CB) domain-containing protein n=1 Tax=Caryophanon tenue TaxID=33978 RepID=A0A1C0Y715_9BACL|nr:site-specific integrase [Caryophanon tenue]OCS82925.1 hypothetical protein A6M13_05860 [Caryophanon tenue]